MSEWVKRRFIHVEWIRVNCVWERNRARTPNTSLIFLFACRATRSCVIPLMTVWEHLGGGGSESLCVWVCVCERERERERERGRGRERERRWGGSVLICIVERFLALKSIWNLNWLNACSWSYCEWFISTHYFTGKVCFHDLSSICSLLKTISKTMTLVSEFSLFPIEYPVSLRNMERWI